MRNPDLRESDDAIWTDGNPGREFVSGEIFLFYEEISHFCVAINQKRIELLDVEAGFVIFSVILKPFKNI